jgi:hypothetical protein
MASRGHGILTDNGIIFQSIYNMLLKGICNQTYEIRPSLTYRLGWYQSVTWFHQLERQILYCNGKYTLTISKGKYKIKVTTSNTPLLQINASSLKWLCQTKMSTYQVSKIPYRYECLVENSYFKS